MTRTDLRAQIVRQNPALTGDRVTMPTAQFWRMFDLARDEATAEAGKGRAFDPPAAFRELFSGMRP